MKKAITVLLWIALLALAVTLISWAGEKEGLRREVLSCQKKNESLRDLYDQAKDKWARASEALNAEKEQLATKNTLLSEQLLDAREKLKTAQSQAQTLSRQEQQARDALALAQREWDQQLNAISREKDALAGRLSEALAVLLPMDETAEPAAGLFPSATPDTAPRHQMEREILLPK